MLIREYPKSENTSCPVCDGKKVLPEQPVFDDRYGYPEEFQLGRCTNCSHRMTLPRLSEADLPFLYGTYYPRKSLTPESVQEQAMSVKKRFSGLLRWWMGTDNQGQYKVRPGQKVLDIGCGSGVSLLEIEVLGGTAWGIEADPNVQSLARALGLRIHSGNLDDRPFPDECFDLIILNQVIEHIPEPMHILKNMAKRLAAGGRVVLVFPNRDSWWCRVSGIRWINWHVPYHLHHFNLDGFKKLAERSGFRMVKSRTITPNLWTLLQWRANRMKPELGVGSLLWRVSEKREADSQISLKSGPIRAMKQSLMFVMLGMIALFNRVIDIAGMGDSLMVELELDDPT